jgi:hypothetical protein
MTSNMEQAMLAYLEVDDGEGGSNKSLQKTA